MQAIILESTGGPEVLKLTDMPLPEPGPYEVQIQHTAIEVNFIDIQQRQGTQKFETPSKIPGVSAAGIITKIGSAVQCYRVDDMVAYTNLFSGGAYCKARNIHNQLVVAIPRELNEKIIGTCLLKGLTAHYLACRTFIARDRSSVLIHAAAGGVGKLLAQWCRALGAYVIGTVGSDEKLEVALAHGCNIAINYTTDGWESQVMEATKQIGVNAVYDGVGQYTFHKSLNCLMNMGTMVSFGSTSGTIKDLDISLISDKSLFFTMPSIAHYKANRMEMLLGFNELCSRIIDGSIKIPKPIEFRLSEASEAHKLIESRKNLSSVILVP